MGIWADLKGTFENLVHFGAKAAGFNIKNTSGVAQIRNEGDTAFANLGAHTLEVQGSNATNKVTITAPAGLSGNVAFILPGADGTGGQVIATDGNGVLSFVNSTSNGMLTQSEAFTQATSSPIAIFTPPANSMIVAVTVIVASPAAGGSPTISIGIAGNVALYMATGQTDLKTAGVYKVFPMADAGATPDPVTATLAADGQTFSGTVLVEYSNPA